MTDPEARPHNPMQKEGCPSSFCETASAQLCPREVGALGSGKSDALDSRLLRSQRSEHLPRPPSPGPWSTSTHLDQQLLFILPTPFCLCFSLPPLPLLVLLTFQDLPNPPTTHSVSLSLTVSFSISPRALRPSALCSPVQDHRRGPLLLSPPLSCHHSAQALLTGHDNPIYEGCSG